MARASKSDQEAALIQQPHGGALLPGGMPGNAGGAGRPPSEVRRACRESFFDRIPVLESIADGRSVYVMTNADDVDMDATIEQLPSAGERVRAVSELGKIGMGGHISMEDVRERLRMQVSVIRSELDDEAANRLLAKLDGVWRG